MPDDLGWRCSHLLDPVHNRRKWKDKEGQVNELQAGSRFPVAVFPESAVLLEPSEITFDGPTQELQPKRMQFVTFHDLKPKNKTPSKQH
jgi:hypothetical protein